MEAEGCHTWEQSIRKWQKFGSLSLYSQFTRNRTVSFCFLLNLVWSETILLRCRNSVKSLWDHFLVLPMSSSKSICKASELSKSSSWVKGEYVRGGTCQPWHHQRPFLPPLIFSSLSRGILLGAWKRFESCHKFTTVPLLGAWVACGTSALHLLKKLAEYSLIFTILVLLRMLE